MGLHVLALGALIGGPTSKAVQHFAERQRREAKKKRIRHWR